MERGTKSVKTPFQVESESTFAQEQTEEECAPFFVDLSSLPSDQLRHLRQVGLLPPIIEPVLDSVSVNSASLKKDNDDDIKSDERIVVLEESMECSNLSEDNEEKQKRDPFAFGVRILRDQHCNYLSRCLNISPIKKSFSNSKLAASYASLDASRPWMIYWCLHSIDLLSSSVQSNTSFDPSLWAPIVHTLESCWNETTVQLSHSEKFSEQDWALLRPLVISNNGTRCVVRAGGFGGGPGQMAHCATTYAAVLALCIIAYSKPQHTTNQRQDIISPVNQMALQLLQSKRCLLYAWFLSLRSTTTTSSTTAVGFRMHHDGEIDVRATYCIFSVASLLALHTTSTTLHAGAAEFVLQCQTYEGGFGGEPGCEAHGGYAFCAIAALYLLHRRLPKPNETFLRSWLTQRQMPFEGGFSGRTNKLVDGCYSFWQGASLVILDLFNQQNDTTTAIESVVDNDDSYLLFNNNNKKDQDTLLFHRAMLQRYILLCAQDVNGGLRDKPSKPRDFYHSCYNLSGLSLAQHASPFGPNAEQRKLPRRHETKGAKQANPNKNFEHGDDHDSIDLANYGTPMLYGDARVNELKVTHPIFNISMESVKFVRQYFLNTTLEESSSS